MYELVLASESPRRRELLTAAGFQFSVHPSKISETLEENLTIDEQILDIARRKAQTSVQSLPQTKAAPRLVLAADTLVVLDNRPLGKPESPSDAVEMLRLLSGRTHSVKTAVSIIPENHDREMSWIETTEVVFHELTTEEIENYVNTGAPMDKAGSYGIQEQGGEFVAAIFGSYTNVVGLPMESLVENLRVRYKIEPEFTLHPELAYPQWQPKPRRS